MLRERFGDAIIEEEEAGDELKIEVAPDRLTEVAQALRDDPALAFDFPADMTAYDTGEQFVVWYRLHSMAHNRTAIIHVRLPREEPLLPTLTGVWPGLDWFERECFDLYGIDIAGHPYRGDLAQMRILMPMDWDGFPFRKDYVPVFSGDPLHGPQETN